MYSRFKKQEWSLPHWWPTGLLVNMVILPRSAWDSLFENRFLRTEKRIFKKEGRGKGVLPFCPTWQREQPSRIQRHFPSNNIPAACFLKAWTNILSQGEVFNSNLTKISESIVCRWHFTRMKKFEGVWYPSCELKIRDIQIPSHFLISANPLSFDNLCAGLTNWMMHYVNNV